jgi:hypothetical protein
MKDPDDELRPEYNFSRGTRGSYAAGYAKGSNVVVLEPDIAARYKTAQEVNEALRRLIKTGTGDS